MQREQVVLATEEYLSATYLTYLCMAGSGEEDLTIGMYFLVYLH